MSKIDVKDLAKNITKAASKIIDQDITELRGFSKNQVEALAKQTELIAEGVSSGDIDSDLREYFLDSLEDMALNFVKTLHGLLLITIEKVWNAIVGVIWKTLDKATGLSLTVPSS